MINIPRRFENCDYKEVPANIKKSFEAISETRRGIYIHGGVGTGKTRIAYALLKEAGERKISCGLWNTTEMFRQFRRDIKRSDDDRADVEDVLLESRGLLVFDDIGAEKLSEWVSETFYLIINRRYEEMIPTIFTSNLDIGQLAERIGDRTVSRIVEMCDIIKLDGQDRRLG